jgi:hypothetical protein
MRHGFTIILIVACFGALFLICYAPVLFLDRQFGYRDAAHYYYPLNQRVQDEWNQGRWPLWEPEENAGVPLLGNPTAAVLYPGKLVFAILPYPCAARVYVVAHSALAFLAMLVLMRSWGTSGFGSASSALAYAFGAPILFQYCNIIYLIGAAWLPLGIHAVDRWARLGRRWGLLELAIVLSMQTLGGDPQAAYLLGLASIGYALGLAWVQARSKREEPAAVRPRQSRLWLSMSLVAIALVVWCVVTLALAQWLPKLRETGKPTPPLRWMLWVPLGVNVAWGLVAVGFLVRWWKRGRKSPMGFVCLGLASSAALAFVLTAAQLLPVIEFTQQTARAAGGGPHEIYAFNIEPYRLLEMVWPNIFGTQLEGNSYWGEMLLMPGSYPKEWTPSLYLGGLTLALAVSSLALRQGPPWRVWFSVITAVSLLGSLGEYTSPIWMARALAVTSRSAVLQEWLPDLGPIDAVDTTPIRSDGYLRDGDGGFYWWLSTVLPGFRQFRFPAKLFTFASLAMAALAGLGWDRLAAARARGVAVVLFVLLVLTLAALAGVMFQRQTILASFRTLKGSSTFGPFEASAGYRAILHSLGQAALVFGLGLLLTILARRRPLLAGAATLILMTADLAAANARYVLTVPQDLFETKPEILRIIEAAERAKPSPGPFRVHRMPLWHPLGWPDRPSKDRVFELVKWEFDTVQPKYGINFGVEYTHTIGVAELYDYEWYFAGFPWKVHDKDVARSLGIEVEKEVVYFPRRAFDMWNTRYFIVPTQPNRWRDEFRGYASFVFQSEQVYPDPDQFIGPKGQKEFKSWIETRDVTVRRNRQEYPRAWVVHNVRTTVPVTGLSRETRSEAMQEILHAGDPIWNDKTQRVYDPHNLAWVVNDDRTELGRYLSGQQTRPSETVKVTYPNPQQAVLEASLDSAGIVVLADVYYPGWELSIDDKPAPIYRVNGMMRGAAVVAGHHRLVYTYAPQSFRVGRLVSIVGLTAMLILGLACARWPIDPAFGGRDGSC